MRQNLRASAESLVLVFATVGLPLFVWLVVF
jgi:hypothetical protein